MSEIPEYLKNNPNYYVKWWRKKDIPFTTSESKSDINNILELFQNLKTEACTIPPWYPWFKLKEKWQDMWYNRYNIEGSKMKTVYVKINDGDNKYKTFNNETDYQWKWYWRSNGNHGKARRLYGRWWNI